MSPLSLTIIGIASAAFTSIGQHNGCAGNQQRGGKCGRQNIAGHDLHVPLLSIKSKGYLVLFSLISRVMG